MSTELEYYNDKERYGEHQYVTLGQLINDYMMSRGADNKTSMTPRHNIIYQFKRGIRELYYDLAKEVRRIELDLSPTLQIALPPDYVGIVRLSYVGEGEKLYPLHQNTSTNIAKAYLQDNDFNILFDHEGDSLLSQVNESVNNTGGSTGRCYTGFTPNVNLSGIFNNGTFNIEKSEGVVYFSSDVKFKRVVLEYVSDGLFVPNGETEENHIKIHKFAESAIMDYVYYSLIKNGMSIPANEKHRARKEYFNSRRLAKRRLSTISIADLKQVFKSDSKWIK